MKIEKRGQSADSDPVFILLALFNIAHILVDNFEQLFK